ncbi:MAG: DNA polymerase beta superfamily protein [Planctomycetota bacterium]|jgi:predicted nucleotidyltransferase
MANELDLDAVRAILAPLDLTPLFLVVGGDHLFGFPSPVPRVRVRGAHTAALSAALGKGGRAASLTLTLLDRGLEVRLTSEEIEKLARRIERGDGTLLEEIHSPLVLEGEAPLAELREIARGFVTRRIHRHYLRIADGAIRRLERDDAKRVRHVLQVFRAVLAGVHALETGEIRPDLRDLLRRHDLPFLEELAARWSRSPLVGDPARFEFYMTEARALLGRLEEAAARTNLPDRPPSPELLREWVARHAG